MVSIVCDLVNQYEDVLFKRVLKLKSDSEKKCLLNAMNVNTMLSLGT